MILEGNESIERLTQNLGLKDTIEVLEYALPRVAEKQKKIQQHLQQKHWEKASLYAHKTISSVRLYGSAELERLLNKVQEHNESERIQLQQQLLKEFNHVIQTIQQWLTVHKIDA